MPDQHGYEGWSGLCAQYEPATNTITVGTLQALIAPTFSMDALEFRDTSWLAWEAEMLRHERESGKCLPTEIHVSVVLSRAPAQITAQLQMQAAEFEDSYEKLHQCGNRSGKMAQSWYICEDY
eukprot:6216050-Amphidinium_carterae.2